LRKRIFTKKEFREKKLLYRYYNQKEKKHFNNIKTMYSAPKVRRNIFKTEEKKGTEEKALLAMDFPAFQTNVNANATKKASLGSQTSYIDVTTKEKEEDKETKANRLEEGWCRLSWDIEGNFVIERSEGFTESETQSSSKKESYHEYVSRKMQLLFDKWDTYKREFIELYGEDAYPRMSPVFDEDTNVEEEDDYEQMEDDYYEE